MTWVLRAGLGLVAFLVVAGGVALAFGPREPVDREVTFDAASLPDDLDTWLAAAEATVPDLRESAAKQIVWAGEPGVPTPLSIVYLHGFSASAEEIRPVPDRAAEALGANLYYTRLSGHGRNGAAMAEPAAGDWIEDVAEALAVGRRIGERVVVIGTSTGGTLAALAAHDSALAEGVAGVVFVSPNFRINSPAAPVLTLPWARHWLPPLVGQERGFTPVNEGHAAHWTTRYPSVSVLPMAALVAHVDALDLGAATLPALFVYSEHDQVVSPAAVQAAIAEWGGPVTAHALVMGPDDDPSSHVIAGDVLSPGQTDRATALIVDWASHF